MKNVASNEKVSTEKEPKESGKEFPRDREQTDKQLRELVEVIHFTEKVSAKIHGMLDEAEIYRTVKEEFAKSERYNASIFLLTDDGSKFRFAETSLSPEKIKIGEKTLGIQSYKGYKFDLNKSSLFSEVVKEGKTIEAKFIDSVCEFFPRPLAYLIIKAIGYEKRSGILTPLKRHGKVIGILVVDSTELAKYFIPSVKNLAQHISSALELAHEYAELNEAQEVLHRSEERYRELTESIRDVFFAMDKDLRYIHWNKASENLTGISAKDAIGKSLTEVFPDVKGTKIEQLYLETLRTQKPQSFVNEFQLKGRDFIFEINTYPSKDGLSVFVKDITERKKMEETLRESEEKYRSMIERAPDLIVTIDEKGIVTSCNSALERGTDYSQHEIIGKHFLETPLLHGIDPAYAQRLFNAIIEEKHPEPIELTWFLKDGTPRISEVRVGLMKKDGKIAGFTAVARDITERKKAEEALRREREMLEMVTQNIGAGLTIISKDYRILWANRVVKEFCGDVEGKVCYSTFHQRSHVCPGCGVKEIFETGKNQVVHERVVSGFSGQNAWLENITTPIRDENGNITAVLELSINITERKKMEEALRESEKRYKALFENARDVIFTGDLKGNITDINRFVEEYGFKRDEVVGKNILKFVSKKYWPKLLRGVAKLSQGNVVEGEIEIITPKGKIISDYRGNPIIRGKKVVGFQTILRNITERKKMEEALRESEEKYRDIVELAPDGIVTLDMKGVITSCNTAATRLTGYSKDEIVGKHFSKLGFLRARDIPKYLRLMSFAVRGKVPKSLEVSCIRKDGTSYSSEVCFGLLRKGGKTVGYLVIGRDITERKKMEEALKRQRDVAITLSGARDLIEALNRLFDNLLEIEEFDCAGFYLFDKETGALDMIAHRGLPDKFVEKVSHFDADSPYTKVVMEGKALYQKTSDFPPVIREDLQSSGILSVAAIPIHYEGEAIGHLNLASYTYDEISVSTRHVLESVGAQIGEAIARLRMEEKLRQYSERLEELVQKRTKELLESEKRYSVLVEEANVGVATLQDGKIVFVNKKGEEISGYSRKELIGLPFMKLVSEEYRQIVMERYARRMKGESVPAIYEIELNAKNGEHIPVEISAARISYQGRSSDLVVVRDIRERKRMEEQRLKLEKLASMGELATMVAHDLRNPLTSIRNASYYIKDTCPARAKPECSTSLEMIDIIEQETIFANNIINDLLDFAAKRPLQKNKQNINKIIESSLTASKIPENIKAKRNFAEKAIATVDGKQLERVFLNLTKNAVQAMSNGGKLTIATNETKGHVEIEFTDTGAGISEENMSKLFEPLFTTKAKGIGMGLAICKKIVEEHSGTIKVKSKVGQGTTFTIKLPKKEEANTQ